MDKEALDRTLTPNSPFDWITDSRRNARFFRFSRLSQFSRFSREETAVDGLSCGFRDVTPVPDYTFFSLVYIT